MLLSVIWHIQDFCMYVLLPPTHIRFVPGNIGSPRLEHWSAGQSVSESVTQPLLYESSDKSRAVSEAPPLSATPPQHSLPTQIHWLLLPPWGSPQVYRSSLCSNWGPRSNMLSYAKCLGLLQQYRSLPRTCPKLKFTGLQDERHEWLKNYNK